MKGKKGIIFAADLMEELPCLRLIKDISNFIDVIKIGYPLILNAGIQIVEKIKKDCGLPIIADFKIMDISETAKNIVSTVIKAGCDGVMVCGVCGPEVVYDCIKEAHNKMVFVFNEFTCMSALITDKVADDTARMAKELGAYGIQAPGTKPHRVQRLRQIVGDDLVIIACGIGAQGPKPGSAIEAGADYEIIGRAIYASVNPRRSAEGIRKSMGLLLR